MTTSFPRLEIASAAERDIRGIPRFTRAIWGARQRTEYGRRISAAMDGLTHFPDLGQRKDDISPGLRARPVGQHVISYRVTDEAVRVLRVLHVRMDATNQFAS